MILQARRVMNFLFVGEKCLFQATGTDGNTLDVKKVFLLGSDVSLNSLTSR